jgi:hypothetical protein
MYHYAIRKTGAIAVLARAPIHVRDGQTLVEDPKYYNPQTHTYDFKRKKFFEKTTQQQRAETATADAASAASEKGRANALRRLKTAVSEVEDPQAQKAFLELAALLGLQLETKRKKKKA